MVTAAAQQGIQPQAELGPAVLLIQWPSVYVVQSCHSF